MVPLLVLLLLLLLPPVLRSQYAGRTGYYAAGVYFTDSKCTVQAGGAYFPLGTCIFITTSYSNLYTSDPANSNKIYLTAYSKTGNCTGVAVTSAAVGDATCVAAPVGATGPYVVKTAFVSTLPTYAYPFYRSTMYAQGCANPSAAVPTTYVFSPLRPNPADGSLSCSSTVNCPMYVRWWSCRPSIDSSRLLALCFVFPAAFSPFRPSPCIFFFGQRVSAAGHQAPPRPPGHHPRHRHQLPAAPGHADIHRIRAGVCGPRRIEKEEGEKDDTPASASTCLSIMARCFPSPLFLLGLRHRRDTIGLGVHRCAVHRCQRRRQHRHQQARLLHPANPVPANPRRGGGGGPQGTGPRARSLDVPKLLCVRLGRQHGGGAECVPTA